MEENLKCHIYNNSKNHITVTETRSNQSRIFYHSREDVMKYRKIYKYGVGYVNGGETRWISLHLEH